MLERLTKKTIIFDEFKLKLIMFISICYLLLPQILFEIMSMKVIWMIGIVGLSVVAIALSWKNIPKFNNFVEIPIYVLVVSEILIVIIFLISGMGGFMGVQAGDYIRTNAVLEDLVNNDWPVVYNESNNISVLNYYIAYFIPGALIGKIFGNSFRIAEIATFIWSVIGMSLGLGLLLIIMKKIKLKNVLIFLCWGGLDWIGLIIVNGSLFYGTNHLEHWASINKDYGNGHIANYMSVASNIYWNPLCFIPAVILVGLIMILIKNEKYKLCIMISCSLLFWSPLVAIGILPFAVVLLIYERLNIKKFLSLSDIISIFVVAFPMVLYFTSVSLSSVGGTTSVIRGIRWFLDNWTILILFVILEFGLVGVVTFKEISEKDTIGKYLVGTAVGWMTICLFIDYGLCHDFSMRATVIAWLVLFTFAIEALDSKNVMYKKIIIFCIIGGVITSATEYSRMLLGVINQGTNVIRSELDGNTISGWGLQYQYVGSPDSVFFNKLCYLDYDKESYKDKLIQAGESYLVFSENQWSVYAYKDDIYVYNSSSEKSSVTLNKITSGEVTSQEIYSSGEQFLYGTLSELDGLTKVHINAERFDSIQLLLKDENSDLNLEFSEDEYNSIMFPTYDKQINAADFSDINWNKGISTGDKHTILFSYSEEKLKLLKNAKSIRVNNETYFITNIVNDNTWISASVDRDATACAYPSLLTVE